MDICLTPEEMRVLGCLLEKKMATPEYYPLSLNALVNAQMGPAVVEETPADAQGAHR